MMLIVIWASCFTNNGFAQETDPIESLRLRLDTARNAQDWKLYGNTYNKLTLAIFKQEGLFWEAFQTGQEALDSIAMYLGKEDLIYANACSNLGYFNRRIGQLQKAKQYYDQTIAAYEQQDPPNPIAISAFNNMLGSVFYMEGDWLQAEKYFKHALQVWEDAGSPYYEHIASVYIQLGLVYRNLKNFEESKNRYRACLDYYFPKIRVQAGQGMALTFIEEQNADSAQYFLSYAQSQEPEEKAFEPSLGFEIQARIYSLQHKDSASLVNFKLAQQSRIERFPFRFKDLVRGEQRIAQQFHKMEMTDSAMIHFEKALSYLKPQFEVPENQEDINLIYPQSALPVYIDMGKALESEFERKGEEAYRNQALSAFEKAYELYIKLQRDRSEEASKLLLGSYMKQMTEAALELLYKQFELAKADNSRINRPNSAVAQNTILWMERYHAGILFAERQKSEKQFANELPDSLKVQEIDMLSKISFLQIQLEKEKDSTKWLQFNKKLFESKNQYRLFRDQVATRFPIYAQVSDKIELPDINRFLGRWESDVSMVAFFVGEERVYGLRLENQKFDFWQVEAVAELTEHIQLLQQFLQDPDYSEKTTQDFIRELQDPIWASLWPHADLKETVYIIPDGLLARLPFEILLASPYQVSGNEVSTSAVFRELPYLFKEKEIGYLHSLSMKNSFSINRTKAQKELGVFAPIYDGSFRLKQNENITDYMSEILSAQIFNNTANKSAFTTSIEDFAYGHLSVHGFANEINPWNAYLQFAPHDSLSERLYVHEIYNLNLPNSLVTLAACDVGKGKIAASEGELSLARAFRYAGAATVIQSRWKADARVAQEIFPIFYQQLSAKEASLTSFHTARANFLSTASPELTHPYYWANFSYWGQNQNDKSYWWLLIVLLPVGVLVLSMVNGDIPVPFASRKEE